MGTGGIKGKGPTPAERKRHRSPKQASTRRDQATSRTSPAEKEKGPKRLTRDDENVEAAAIAFAVVTGPWHIASFRRPFAAAGWDRYGSLLTVTIPAVAHGFLTELPTGGRPGASCEAECAGG
ncbi:hypothetical protein GCM10011487_11410 [Steroidobacter agaridevorans]|uniref:Uncharacterized protein n=1 Tax=Steroidobacter agaridevorans TaxID=2695856 RepID=A0A829Y804_9GAMM|nr:hypothetical protein GCM10011487_11410 [Steroidobacter agaridevorans]